METAVSEAIKFWNLNSPKMCRDFLKSLRFGPPDKPDEAGKITHFDLEDGKRVSIDDATDEQVIDYANQIAEMIGVRRTKKK